MAGSNVYNMYTTTSGFYVLSGLNTGFGNPVPQMGTEGCRKCQMETKKLEARPKGCVVHLQRYNLKRSVCGPALEIQRNYFQLMISHVFVMFVGIYVASYARKATVLP